MKSAVSLLIIFFLLFSPAYAYVLSTADTIGRDRSQIAGIYSASRITTYVPGIISADLTTYSTGFVFQYGVLDNFDIMLGLGTVNYTITPDVAGFLRMEGGTLFGLGAEYGVLREGKDMPLSLSLLLQYTTIPAHLTDTGVKAYGWDYDTYTKVIISKKFAAFLPYIALGVNSRLLKIGGSESQSSIPQIDLGWGTAVSEHMFVGVEINWSAAWQDPVMDRIFAASTKSEALGVSFGTAYLF